MLYLIRREVDGKFLAKRLQYQAKSKRQQINELFVTPSSGCKLNNLFHYGSFQVTFVHELSLCLFSCLLRLIFKLS